jgi:citronellol/citronellal dehydrogenase
MSLMTLGWASEFKEVGIAANSLWPVTTIATAAVRNLLGGQQIIERSRYPTILAEAAFHILNSDAKTCSGNTFLDEDVLKAAGVSDFTRYDVQPGSELNKDLYID